MAKPNKGVRIGRYRITPLGLITLGVLDTPVSHAARQLRSQGMTVREIAEALDAE